MTDTTFSDSYIATDAALEALADNEDKIEKLINAKIAAALR